MFGPCMSMNFIASTRLDQLNHKMSRYASKMIYSNPDSYQVYLSPLSFENRDTLKDVMIGFSQKLVDEVMLLNSSIQGYRTTWLSSKLFKCPESMVMLVCSRGRR